ncbi:MAG: NADH:flavin oxidoreductase [Desulfomonile tiedjei]|nr:NADH:flavin oxidoreductase [Desulfomonile tiedjei]
MSILFSSGKIGSIEIANRVVHSATFESMATVNGEVTDQLVKRYRNIAKGGTGLIVPGYVSVHRSGKAFERQVELDSDAIVPGLASIVDAVHEHGGKIVFQLAHAGRQTTKQVAGQAPLGPSSVGRDPINFVKPREMTEADIREVIRAFGKAAKRAINAGADGIQLHGAHGYLINQFLSPFFNKRTDKWGDSEGGRFRFLREIFCEVKSSVPERTPILIKLNTHDHTPAPGITPDLAQRYAHRLVELGIDAIEISSGTAYYSFMNTCRGSVPVKELAATLPWWKRLVGKMMLSKMAGKFDLEEGYHTEAARIMKPVMGKVPLILVGGIRHVRHMEQVLEEGLADFISMSRPFIREPFLVNRLKEGKTEKASCVSCNRCIAGMMGGEPLRCLYKPA